MTALALETLTDEQLFELPVDADTLAEAERRDQRDRGAVRHSQSPWGQADAEWQAAAWAQYDRALDYCRGYLLNDRGEKAGGEFTLLWQGSEERARRYASDELITFWDHVEPRTPPPSVFRAAWQAKEDDMADYTEEPAEQFEEAEEPSSAARTGPRHVTTYADIEPVDVEWVWDGRIPMAEVTLLVAKGGTGKTFAMTDLAARVTRGDPMPDGTPGCPAGAVIFISGDDDPAAVLSWRIRAAQAELGKVIDYSEPDGAPFKLGGKATCIPLLHQLVASRGDVRMVVLDPLARLSAVSLTATKTINAEVMDPLRAMARRTGCAVVVVHHQTKAGEVAGGQALYDSARSLLTVEAGEDGVRVISVEKANMAEDHAEPVRYRLTGSARADTHVEWLGENTVTSLEGAPGQNALLRALAKSGPADAQALAARTGLPYDSVRVLLTKLKKAGLAANPRRGVWAVNHDNVRVITREQHEAEVEAGTAKGPVVLPETVPHESGYGVVEVKS